MVMAKVDAGICGFKTIIKATPKERQIVEISMQTECPSLKPMAEELKEVDAYKECFAKVGESPVFQLARKYCKHAACPVPTAIIKEVEVAAKLALPKNVEIELVTGSAV
jgi:hypothetical protein